jgi:NitT/TauT family transport system ATP-binding protein
VIEVQRVSKVFDGAGGPMVAIEDISLSVGAREFVSLIGPSGCGKSTLLRLIGDLVTPTRGTITVGGKTPRRARLDRDYGIVFQTPVLYEWRTVLRNVRLPLEVMAVPPEEGDRRAEAMLALVGLTPFRDYYPWQLSGGMQQRVAIARALVFRPSILLMDEPFGALDELTRERLNSELLSTWSKTESTVLFVTHSIQEAVFLSTRVLVMSPRPGRIAGEITVDLPRPRAAETRTHPRFFALVTQVRQLLREEVPQRGVAAG